MRRLEQHSNMVVQLRLLDALPLRWLSLFDLVWSGTFLWTQSWQRNSTTGVDSVDSRKESGGTFCRPVIAVKVYGHGRLGCGKVSAAILDLNIMAVIECFVWSGHWLRRQNWKWALNYRNAEHGWWYPHSPGRRPVVQFYCMFCVINLIYGHLQTKLLSIISNHKAFLLFIWVQHNVWQYIL